MNYIDWLVLPFFIGLSVIVNNLRKLNKKHEEIISLLKSINMKNETINDENVQSVPPKKEIEITTDNVDKIAELLNGGRRVGE